MRHATAGRCAFETSRLRVGEWHAVAQEVNLDLVSFVVGLLTEATTAALPETWQGNHSPTRARAWIEDRDRESPTLVVIDKRSGAPIGLVILFESPGDGAMIDLRIGYLFDESSWGQGLATELITGLVRWARLQATIRTLTGGIDPANPASEQVLVRNGFVRVGGTNTEESEYQLALDPGRAGRTPQD